MDEVELYHSIHAVPSVEKRRNYFVGLLLSSRIYKIQYVLLSLAFS